MESPFTASYTNSRFDLQPQVYAKIVFHDATNPEDF